MLVLRFALATAVVFVAAGVSLALLVQGVVKDHARGVALDQSRLLVDTALRGRLRPSDFRRPSAARRRELDGLFARELLVGRAVLVRLLSPSGTVSYSSDHLMVGVVPGDVSAAQRVLRGVAGGEVASIELGGRPSRRVKVLEAFVPVRVGAGNAPAGVLELYSDYAPVAEQIQATVVPVAVVLAVALLLLYASLFPILRHITGTLRARTAELADQGEALRQSLSARQRIEETLRRSEEEYRLLFAASPHPMWVYDGESLAFLAVNDAAVRAYGYSRDEFLAMTIREIRPPADLPQLLEAVERRSRTPGQAVPSRHLTKQGSLIEVEITGGDVVFEGRAARLVHAHDLTARNQAEQRRREAEMRYRTLVEQLPLVTYIDEPNATSSAVYMSPQIEPILGYTVEEWIADPEFFPKHLHPDDRDRVLAEHARWLAEGGRCRSEYRLLARDGHIVWFRDDYHLIEDEHGDKRTLGFLLDISDQKALEAQFLQSQKLEAVGRLAGGIAHDFNNLLQAIHGFSELLLDELDEGGRPRERVVEIGKAADRASELTRQLLAFSRKQALQPRVLDLNEVVRGMAGLLGQLLGSEIEIVNSYDPELRPVRADAAQLEQVILNLAVNARDAMPTGGRLTIETANVDIDAAAAKGQTALEPGPYLMLSVSDTGCGMDPETQALLFEPFFTTKELGKGTGLGLSTVYGIVKQSGGCVIATSEPGRGATFRIYLPPTQEQPERQPQPAGEDIAAVCSETILLVEDEPAVRAVAREMLAGAGYTVLEAGHASQALDVAGRHEGSIDLLITDSALPTISGGELIERLAAQRPGIGTLLISGYAHASLDGDRPLPAGARFLQKPFATRELLEAVHDALRTRSPRTGNGAVRDEPGLDEREEMQQRP